MTDEAAVHDTLRRLITGARPAQMIAAAAEFRIADLLADGPKSSAELAEQSEANADAMHRVMRALAQLGVFAMLDDGRFALAPMSEHLRTDAPRSLHVAARTMGADFMVLPILNLVHTIKTGETASEHVFGMTRFEYMAAHPEAGALFNDFMTTTTAGVSAAVVAAYDWNSFDTIMDVGGGNGTLVAAILGASTRSRGIVFDLPHCRAGAEEYLASAGVASRCEFVGGDFFKSIPAEADGYLLKWIIHDYDDARSIAILQACRRAMSPTSKLLLVEQLLPSGNESAPEVVFFDVMMLLNTGGRERTEAEYRALLAAADLRLTQIVQTVTSYCILEAAPSSGDGS